MSATIRRRGRPLGETSRIVLAAVLAEPMPARTIAETLHMQASRVDRTS